MDLASEGPYSSSSFPSPTLAANFSKVPSKYKVDGSCPIPWGLEMSALKTG